LVIKFAASAGRSENVGASQIIRGVIFSDLGQASSFMALNWVQTGLKECLGFAPFPATLNVRPDSEEDARGWSAIQEAPGIALRPAANGFCSARLYRVQIHRPASSGGRLAGGILLPNVVDYPKDKIEVIAPVRLKDEFHLCDGERLTLELVN
jgi:CTP-dependent riboflavin kinase